LHPLLVALTIVLHNGEDFSLISASHPQLAKHKYYKPSAVFPDLSPFLPSKEDCWWEDLGASHQDLSVSHFHNAFAAAKSLSGQATEEPAAVDATVAAEKLMALEEPASPKEPASLEGEEPAAGRQQVRIKILPPKPPHQSGEDSDVEMSVVERQLEPAMVSIYGFLFHLLTVLEGPSTPQPEAKGCRPRRPQTLQAPCPSGC
jgi:hypothetical protein